MAKAKNEANLPASSSHNKILMEFQTPEFGYHHKSRRWLLIAGIITLLLVAYAIYSNSATMAIVFIVLAGVYVLTHEQKPKIIDVKITELGIYVDLVFYPYNTINAFWVVYHPPYVQTLNLRISNRTNSRVVIQLNNQNPVEIRKLLAGEIPEVEGEQESMSDMFSRLLRL